MAEQRELQSLLGGAAPAVGGRRRWMGLTAMLAALGAVEVAVVALLGHRFLPTAVAVGLDVLGVLALLVVGAACASVAVSHHRIEDGEARLVLGLLAEARVPLAVVAHVEGLPPLAPVEAAEVGPAYADGRLVLTAAAGLPRVRLVLASPVPARLFLRRRDVTEVVASYEGPSD